MQSSTDSSDSASSTATVTQCIQDQSRGSRIVTAVDELGRIYIQSAIECAERLRSAGCYDKAIDILVRTYQYATTMIGQVSTPALHVLWQIGRTYHVASNLQPAMSVFEQVLVRAQLLSHQDIVADCLFRLAHMRQHAGDFISSETYYRDALDVAIRIHGTKYHMDVATILYNMGLLVHGLGKLFAAHGLYTEAIHIATHTGMSSEITSNPNGAFIAKVLERVIPIIEETTGLSFESILTTINQHLALAQSNSALWETLAKADLGAMLEVHAMVNDNFCAAAA